MCRQVAMSSGPDFGEIGLRLRLTLRRRLSTHAFEMKASVVQTGTFRQIAKSGKTSNFPHLVPS
jgi:hypothetical protein